MYFQIYIVAYLDMVHVAYLDVCEHTITTNKVLDIFYIHRHILSLF